MSETFCWLPPESDCTGCSIDASRMLEAPHEIVDGVAARAGDSARRGGSSARSTWIVVFARTLRTGKSDSRARSPLSSTTPARSGPSGDLGVELVAVAAGCPVERSTPASARRNCT